MPPDNPKSDKKQHNSWWVFSTYFAEGFPYAIVHSVAEVLFQKMGVSLKGIGLTALFHLPWNLKFLWGPFLDQYATKRKWLLWTELGLCALLATLAFSSQLSYAITVTSALFVAIATVSATHDVAIDGYYLEALDDKQQSQFVGFRAAAYKIAMLMVNGPLLLAIAVLGWLPGLLLLAIIMTGLMGLHEFLPHREDEKHPFRELFRNLFKMRLLLSGLVFTVCALAVKGLLETSTFTDSMEVLSWRFPGLFKISIEGWIGLSLLTVFLSTIAALPILKRLIEGSDSFYAQAFMNFLEQPQIGRILAFVVLFRAGEALLIKMRYPFLVELDMSLAQYSLANGTIGLVLSFTATLLGGFLISRDTLRRWIWPFVLMQNLLNLLFAALGYWSLALPEGQNISVWILSAVIGAESFGSGLGTAVFMVYLMRCCRPGYKAAHMAIVTALMSVSYTLAGVSSGFVAEWLGYGHYFSLSFLATIPGMMLIPFIPHLDAPNGASEA